MPARCVAIAPLLLAACSLQSAATPVAQRPDGPVLDEAEIFAPEAEAALIRESTRPEAVPVQVVYPGSELRSETLPDATQQSVPAWIVFAMFFVVFPLSTSLLGERREGTLQRLALLNASHQSVLLAKLPVYLTVTVIQALLMLAMGVWIVPLLGGEALQLGGRWLALLPITIATGAPKRRRRPANRNPRKKISSDAGPASTMIRNANHRSPDSVSSSGSAGGTRSAETRSANDT